MKSIKPRTLRNEGAANPKTRRPKDVARKVNVVLERGEDLDDLRVANKRLADAADEVTSFDVLRHELKI